MPNFHPIHHTDQHKAQAKTNKPAPPTPTRAKDIFQFFESPETLHPEDVLSVQHQVGNQVVQRALEVIQPQGDTASGVIQRDSDSDDEVSSALIPALPSHPLPAPLATAPRQVTRPTSLRTGLRPDEIRALKATPPRSLQPDEVQAAPDGRQRSKNLTNANGELAPDLNAAIQKKRGGGASLPESVQREAKKTLGREFKEVRIHTDEEAHQLSRAIHARAFTIGKDIFFKRGVFAPGTTSGRETLIHELTHVVQQSGGKSSGKLKLGAPDTAHEKEADQIGKKHAVGISIGAAHSGAVQAQDEEELQAQPDAVGTIQRGKDDDWETDPEPVGKQPKPQPISKEKFNELTGQLSGQLSKGTHKGAMQKVLPHIKGKTESMKLGSSEHMSRLNDLEKKPELEKQKKRAYLAGLATEKGKKNREAREAENEKVKAKQEEKEAGTFKGGAKKAWKEQVSDPFKTFTKGLPGKISGGLVKGGVGAVKGLGKGLFKGVTSGFTSGFKQYSGFLGLGSKDDEKDKKKEDEKDEEKGDGKNEKQGGKKASGGMSAIMEEYAKVLQENKDLKAKLAAKEED